MRNKDYTMPAGLCSGCDRALPVKRFPELKQPEWRTIHIVPEEGAAMFCRQAFVKLRVAEALEAAALAEFKRREKARPCPCGVGIDDDGDGNCGFCAPRRKHARV